jgi:hypothetical protein
MICELWMASCDVGTAKNDTGTLESLATTMTQRPRIKRDKGGGGSPSSSVEHAMMSNIAAKS